MIRHFLPVGVCCFFIAAACGEEDYAASARAFVKECLSNPKVFVYNPPTDRNPYKDLSPQHRHELMAKIMRDGSLLVLHLDGMPAKFESKKMMVEHGVSKSWHGDGRVRSEEDFDNGKGTSDNCFSEPCWGLRNVFLCFVGHGLAFRC